MVDFVAVTCVVDSSLALFAEWQHLLQEYVSPLLQRLHEHHVGRHFRVAVVCYAPSSIRPTPLLSTQFFGSPTTVMAKLRNEASKLGIGQTGSGGNQGMAVLEGLVAAIEQFDILKESLENVSILCHIIHLAVSQPDSSERPLWNSLPHLDSITWDTLASELRKRDINYSQILLRQIPRLSDLQNSVAGTAQNAWFSVRPAHSIRLMGYPPAQKGGIKRPGEAANSPDPKRGKMQPTPNTPNQPQTSQLSPRANGSNPPAANIQKSSQVTPTISHAIPPAQAVQQPSAVPQPQIQHSAAQPTTSSPASQPPAPAQSVPPRQPTPPAQLNTSNTSVPNPQPNQPLASSLQGMSQQWSMLERFAEQLKLTERMLLAKAGEINNLRANGKTKEADEHLERLTPELRKLAQARQLLQVKRLALRGQVPEPGQNQAVKANSSVTEFQHVKVETGEIATQATGQASGPSQPQLSQAAGMHPNPTESQLAAQMQKLIEQRNRTPHVPPTNISAIDPASGSGHAATEPPPNTIIWKGAFVWRGLDSVPMSIQVMVPLVPRGTPIRADNWPSSMTLTSSPEPAAPLPMLNEWIKKHNCAPFPIQILPGGDAPHNNENQYKALVRLLAEKNVYALAGWNGPNGTLDNKILIFAIKAQQLGGAFYPGPGSIPDMPKASICGIDLANAAPPLAMILSKLSTEQQALLAQLPPEKRLAQLRSMVLRHQAQLSQTRSQQQPQRPINSWENSGGLFGGQANATSVLNASASLPPQVPSGATMMSYNLPQVHPQGMVTSPSLHQRNISGSGNTGGVGGVSYEMLQSFMQRSGTNGQG